MAETLPGIVPTSANISPSVPIAPSTNAGPVKHASNLKIIFWLAIIIIVVIVIIKIISSFGPLFKALSSVTGDIAGLIGSLANDLNKCLSSFDNFVNPAECAFGLPAVIIGVLTGLYYFAQMLRTSKPESNLGDQYEALHPDNTKIDLAKECTAPVNDALDKAASDNLSSQAAEAAGAKVAVNTTYNSNQSAIEAQAESPGQMEIEMQQLTQNANSIADSVDNDLDESDRTASDDLANEIAPRADPQLLSLRIKIWKQNPHLTYKQVRAMIPRKQDLHFGDKY